MLEFMTNRKNLFVGDDKKIKLPDFSVYSQGVQFYQEEIDELDNQHRVRLTCREISTTPEKILIDLVSSEKTSVVLCSATASSWSVVSNYDIKYLKQTLGDKIHTLSKTERETFDNLVERTYPKEHCVEIVPLEKYEYTDKRENSITLPEKYRQFFSTNAINEGLADKWFKVTYRSLKKTAKDMDDLLFQLYRLYQFIETYYWFIHHDDVHSMIYFQNRTGDKDKEQIHLLSCLIDGTYKCQDGDFDDEGELSLCNIIEDKGASATLEAEYNALVNGINRLLDTLKEREKNVLIMRFGLNKPGKMTLEEIGKIYGVTKECIRQTETKALKKLRENGRSAALYEAYVAC